MHPLAFRSFSRHLVCASKSIVPRPDRRECWVEVYEPLKHQTASEIKKLDPSLSRGSGATHIRPSLKKMTACNKLDLFKTWSISMFHAVITRWRERVKRDASALRTVLQRRRAARRFRGDVQLRAAPDRGRLVDDLVEEQQGHRGCDNCM